MAQPRVRKGIEIPLKLWTGLEVSAKKNGISMNKEIINRLTKSFEDGDLV